MPSQMTMVSEPRTTAPLRSETTSRSSRRLVEIGDASALEALQQFLTAHVQDADLPSLDAAARAIAALGSSNGLATVRALAQQHHLAPSVRASLEQVLDALSANDGSQGTHTHT